MKIKYKEGLSFGIGMTVFFIIKNIWEAPQLTAAIITKCLFAGLIGGAVAGVFFGLISNKLKPKIFKQSHQPK